ncbi:epimerase [Sphingorhabdus lutea]|uniref:Epimerase n=1 Tax=Sphingorhabdus lutea TaxID=1913578 RepID=A0A1L3JE44_9SPHN|nr:NAD(P)H-binding protein [Sphingorhabdus lutea]APG63390.1 epimerase [Sphingorhabdus lutea]
MTPSLPIIAMTGATGFVGKRTLMKLVAAGYHVRALTRRMQPEMENVTWVLGSLNNKSSLSNLCEGASAALHIAGVVNAPDMAGFELGNVAGTQNMLNAAKAAGITRFIHVSSLSARAPQLSDYGQSKYRAETCVQNSRMDWTMVRPPAIYGPGDTEMLDMFKMARWGFMIMPPSGHLSAIHVDDLADFLIRLIPHDDGLSGKIFDVDDGKEGGWTHHGFARSIGWAMGKSVTPISIPGFLLKAGGHIDRFIRRDKAKLTPDRAAYMCNRDWRIDPANRPPSQLWSAKIKTKTGLEETVKWYRNEGWL